MTAAVRCVLGVLITVATMLVSSCNGESGIGVSSAGPRAQWGGGSSGPGVIVMGGGPVFH
jgi:hypothetical protein